MTLSQRQKDYNCYILRTKKKNPNTITVLDANKLMGIKTVTGMQKLYVQSK